MADTFSYKARNRSGKIINGTLEADSRQAAAMRLRNEGFFIANLQKKAGAKGSFLSYSLTGPPKLNNKALSLFSKQFAVMARTGMPITKSLDILSNQTGNKILRDALSRIRRAVSGGSSLADALSGEKCFPSMFVNMIAAGEMAGTLDEVLTQMSAYYERQDKMHKEIQQATMYPSVVLVFAFVMIMVVLFLVLPQFADIYRQFGAPLPVFTQVIISIRDLFMQYWYIPVSILVGLGIGFKVQYSTKVGRRIIDGFILKIPLIGGIISKIVLAQFARALSLMVKSGVTMMESLEVTEKIIGNRAVTADLESVKKGVKQGQGISAPFKNARTFPILVKQMLEVGEETGNLSETLEYMADFYDDEVTHQVLRLTALIEPFMIFILGIVVAIIALSVVLPMFNIAQVAL